MGKAFTALDFQFACFEYLKEVMPVNFAKPSSGLMASEMAEIANEKATPLLEALEQIKGYMADGIDAPLATIENIVDAAIAKAEGKS